MKNKIYKYDGKLYSDDYFNNDNIDGGDLSDLLSKIEEDHPSVYHEHLVTARYVGDEYYGTDDDKDEEETLTDIIDYGYGEDIGLEELTEEE